ncbi:fructose-bisphosphate aldolase class I [Acuticoccus sediminis]|uniref:Probable fructose-bisphosphate aldolase class 1 n=1 Tax=Acuticoccus sediminis TaxID=2184697 RepID=A0A8B2NDT4_9HYPH|nr:class I fructose-bisphosphate aldolase [Acuticoccus sediminis]RAH96939.1 fructose-bisphosphate aldolase class I [Acuticoccus sediminis]
MSETLQDIAAAMMADGQGILAADESTGTIQKRFDQIGVENTEANRQAYRELLFTADEAMKNYVSGVILFDETLRQSTLDGRRFAEVIKAAGAVPGIKVDAGAKPLALFPGEKVTEGLDGLRGRLQEYYKLGARFAKWRAVIDILPAEGLPTTGAIACNAHALARYAALCQENGIVPIVEPEVIMDGPNSHHDVDTCYKVTELTLNIVFDELYAQRVDLTGMILKPNMIVPGQNGPQVSTREVAERTVECLKATVPAAVPGIAFLSGGQSDEAATEHLAIMNQIGGFPWKMTFSYGRALQQACLKAWSGKKENVPAAQAAFKHRAKMNGLAALGRWRAEDEREAA